MRERLFYNLIVDKNYTEMKRVVVFIVLSLCVFALHASEIKILTLNVLNSMEYGGWNTYNWSKSDGRTRGQKVVDVILKSDADVICVQEYLHNNDWIKDELERSTGKKWYIRILPRNCAIVSRFPIRSHGNMFLTPIQLPGCKIINVMSVHQFVYTYIPYVLYQGQKVKSACNEAIRLNHNSYWNAIVEELSMAKGRGEAVVLAGDFNEPSHLDYSKKAKKLGLVKSDSLFGMMSNILLDSMQMRDAWVEKRIKEKADECSLRGMTWSPTTWSYKKEIDDQRIDFIYFTPKNFTFIDAQLIGEIPVVDIVGDKVDLQFEEWPSDHRGVLVVLSVN